MAPERPGDDSTARVLVVDDEPMLAELIGEWVAEKWACDVVNGGSDALERLEDDYDVVLLDRQMPDLSGDEVLRRIRSMDLPVRVMLVSAIEPDFDLLDLPFDDYIRKPVDRPSLQKKVEGLLLRRTYRPDVERFFVCAAKLDALEAAKSDVELAEHEGYLELRATADELRQAVPATLGRRSDFVADLYDADADD